VEANRYNPYRKKPKKLSNTKDSKEIIQQKKFQKKKLLNKRVSKRINSTRKFQNESFPYLFGKDQMKTPG